MIGRFQEISNAFDEGAFRVHTLLCRSTWKGARREISVDEWEGALGALSSWTDGGCHVWGSAAILAPGLAVAAKHVLDEFQGRNGSFEDNKHDVFLTAPAFGVMELWSVNMLVSVPNQDAVVLELSLVSDTAYARELRVFQASARMPLVGENVTAIGFIADQQRFEFY